MRTILRLTAFICLTTVGVAVVFWLFGCPFALLTAAPVLFVTGIAFLSLSAILDRLTRLELLVTSSHPDAAKRIKTDLGDFELLGPVEGEATCLACRKIAPKAGLYYNQAMDVYYHPQCLAQDRSR
jgi:hypothetical protein